MVGKTLSQRQSSGSPASEHRNRKIIIAVAIAAVIIVAALLLRLIWRPAEKRPDISNVVVLPANVFGPPELSYLSDAVPGTLSILLGQVPYLDTRLPPNSVEMNRFQGNLPRIAELYGVQTVILPAITVEGERLVLNLEIVDPSTRRVVWRGRYKGRRDGYNEMLRAAADGAGRALRPNQVSLGTTMRGLASNSAAELAYRQGQHFFNRYNNEHHEADFTNAMDAFQLALRDDPKLANAAASIAWLYMFRQQGGEIDDASASTELNRWANRALEIDPKCGLALSAQEMSMVWLGSDLPNELSLSLKAAANSPGDTLAVVTLVHGLAPSLALQNAVEVEAVHLDPLYLHAGVEIARNVRKLGRPEEGILFADQILQLEPTLTTAIAVKAGLLVDLNRIDEADNLLKTVSEDRISARTDRYEWLTAKLIVAMARHDVEGERMVRNEITKLHETTPNFGDWWFDQESVGFLIKFGHTDRAYDVLNENIRKGHAPAYDWLMTDSAFTKIRDEKKFKPILERSRKDFLGMIAILDQAKARGDLPSFLERPLEEIRTQYPR